MDQNKKLARHFIILTFYLPSVIIILKAKTSFPLNLKKSTVNFMHRKILPPPPKTVTQTTWNTFRRAFSLFFTDGLIKKLLRSRVGHNQLSESNRLSADEKAIACKPDFDFPLFFYSFSSVHTLDLTVQKASLLAGKTSIEPQHFFWPATVQHTHTASVFQLLTEFPNILGRMNISDGLFETGMRNWVNFRCYFKVLLNQKLMNFRTNFRKFLLK